MFETLRSSLQILPEPFLAKLKDFFFLMLDKVDFQLDYSLGKKLLEKPFREEVSVFKHSLILVGISVLRNFSEP